MTPFCKPLESALQMVCPANACHVCACLCVCEIIALVLYNIACSCLHRRLLNLNKRQVSLLDLDTLNLRLHAQLKLAI